MCGIAGIVDHQGRWSREELARIARSMADLMVLALSCGLTRVADRFAHFNFYGAFKANPMGTFAATGFAVLVVWSFLHLAFKVPTPDITLSERDWTRLRNALIVALTLNYVFVIIQHRHAIL
jgi:hypothetical protein